MKHIVLAAALAVGSLVGASLSVAPGADAHKKTTSTTSTTSAPSFALKDVTVLDAKTVDATFSNPLAASNTDLSLRVFHAPHFDHKTPHSHEAANVTLLNDGRTARVTLTRNLHPRDRLCDDNFDPRCSTDRLPFVVTEARDIHGQKVSDDRWEVWAVGSRN